MAEYMFTLYSLNKKGNGNDELFVLDVLRDNTIDSHLYYFIIKNDDYNITKIFSLNDFLRKIQEKGLTLDIVDSDLAISIIKDFTCKKVKSFVFDDELGLVTIDNECIRRVSTFLVNLFLNKKNYK